jgi:hypothetical protein
LAILIIGYVVIALVYWTIWKGGWQTQFWWILTLPALGVAFWTVMFAMILKGGDDAKTKSRSNLISQECDNINRTYLTKSDVSVRNGSYGAWLEINYDPTKSNYLKGVKFNYI